MHYIIGGLILAVSLALLVFATIAQCYSTPVTEPEVIDEDNCPFETCETDREPYFGTFLDRDHYHNMTGESDPELIVWTHCLEITHCPSVCDCYLDEKPCTASLLPDPLEYVGKHRAYNPHKVYRGDMSDYTPRHA